MNSREWWMEMKMFNEYKILPIFDFHNSISAIEMTTNI